MRTLQVDKNGRLVEISSIPYAPPESDPYAPREEYGGYSEVEMDCRGCMGPCGRCHETDPFPPLPREPSTDTSQDRILDAPLRDNEKYLQRAEALVARLEALHDKILDAELKAHCQRKREEAK